MTGNPSPSPPRNVRQIAVLSCVAAAPLPALALLIGVLTACAVPPGLAELERSVLWIVGFPVALWFPVRVLLGSRLNLFADPARLVAGAARGRIPHLVVTFLIVQTALFWLTLFLVDRVDLGGCGS